MNNYSYDRIMTYTSGFNPSVIHNEHTYNKEYFTKYLYQRILSVFEFSGLPDTWAENYFEFILFNNGYIAIAEFEDFGVIPQECTLQGKDIFFQPKTAHFGNPAIKVYNDIIMEIGERCLLIRMQPDYQGISDIVSLYSDLLSMSIDALAINILNSKDGKIFQAKSKGAAASIKKLNDQIQSGNLISILDQSCFDAEGNPLFIEYNIDSTYNAGERLADYQSILNQFDMLVGIKPETDKKERLNVLETQTNNKASQPLSDLWLETMQKDIKKVNEKFNLNIAVKKKYDFINEEEKENDPID